MNTRRVAALLRELAEELERDDAAPAAAARKAPRKRRTPRLTRPENVTDFDRALARSAARKAGIAIR